MAQGGPKSGGIIMIGLFIIAAVIFGGKFLVTHGLIPGAKHTAASVPSAVNLPSDNAGGSATSVSMLPIPSSEPAQVNGPQVRMEGYAWNAQMGLLYAIGGPSTTRGSLMEKYGVNVHWSRQDDNNQLQSDLLKTADEMHKGVAQPTEGVHFVTIMGDGAAAFLQGINPKLKKFGADFIAEICGVIGYSRGEDKLMGPPAWLTNPRLAIGKLVACVLRDGDWNILVIWAGNNGLKVNPDEKTFDPDAINVLNADNNIDAAAKYISGYTETRKVVKNGVPTGETVTIGVTGIATWTPGDVTAAEKKGGLVSILSTKENKYQMPCVVIGIKKWDDANRTTLDNMLMASYDAADQIRAYPQAKQHAAEIENALYGENKGAGYWLKYFDGVIQPDKQGIPVSLGGSSVCNLSDAIHVFGLERAGGQNLVQATYEMFGKIVVQQYPRLVPSFPPASEVINVSYVADLQAKNPNPTPAEAPETFSGTPGATVGDRDYNVTFNSGQATFTPKAESVLRDLIQNLGIAGGTYVEVHGHTDNTGSPDANQRLQDNQRLAEARAFAVQQWLESHSPTNFPAGRVRVFAHGQMNPVASNDTPEGRAKNRRVQIVLKSTSQ